MRKERGSAIVIAMLLVSAVGAVGFTFGKVLDIQINNSLVHESSIGAFYAAESGLEEGFLRYRVGHGSSATVYADKTGGQVPPFSDSAKQWLSAPTNVMRTNLTDIKLASNATTGIDKSSTFGLSELNAQYYDLRMGSASGTSASYSIARDETLKIDLGDMFSSGVLSNLDLSFKMNNQISTPSVFFSGKCTLIEAKFQLQAYAGGPVIEKKKLFRNSTCPDSSIISDYGATINYVFSGSKATLSGLKTKMIGSATYSRAALFLKPIGSDIDLTITETGLYKTQHPLNGSVNKIVSTGYFGGVARTLEVKVNTKSGSLYDLYDYVIFKNE